MYGPYGSFAPTYDSSRATITKEQSDLLYSTYGDDTGIHYAKRLVRKVTVMRQTFKSDQDQVYQNLPTT